MTESHQESYRTALHEAAHAVVAHFMGVDVLSISIVRDEDVAGQCFIYPSSKVDLDSIEEAAILFAGLCMEMRVYPTVAGFGEDMRRVAHLTQSMEGYKEDGDFIVKPNAATKAAWALCETFITTYGAVIELLADVLIQRYTIRGAEIIYDLISELTSEAA